MSINYSSSKAALKLVTKDDYDRFVEIFSDRLPFRYPYFRERARAYSNLKRGIVSRKVPTYRGMIWYLVSSCLSFDSTAKKSDTYANYIKILYKMSFEELPLLINSSEPLISSIATWRLSVGK